MPEKSPILKLPEIQEMISVKGKKPVTTSLIVAERFGKRHDNVVNSIRKIIKPDYKKDFNVLTPKEIRKLRDFSRLNYKERSYVDERGREQVMYEITYAGFNRLVMNFQGAKADLYKVQFVEAFDYMVNAVSRQQSPLWNEDREEGKKTTRDFQKALKRLADWQKAEGSRNHHRVYSTFNRMLGREVFGLKRVPENYRDMLSESELRRLEVIERIALNELENALASCADYHRPYFRVRSRVRSVVGVGV